MALQKKYYYVLIKTANTTPKQRWQIIIKPFGKPSIFDKSFSKFKTYRRYTTAGSKNLRCSKYRFKTKLYPLYTVSLGVVGYIVYNYGYIRYPLREFLWCKSIFNQIKPFLCSNSSYPGFKFVNYTSILNFQELANQVVPVSIIPINGILSCLFGKNNTHMTYAKASGTSAIKRKIHKKIKLMYIELPSTNVVLLPIFTYAIFSTNNNLHLNNVVEGGWGYYTKQRKNITVRGVAKNPVDHPNGGRTKAKQPELSPWGWIAKKNK